MAELAALGLGVPQAEKLGLKRDPGFEAAVAAELARQREVLAAATTMLRAEKTLDDADGRPGLDVGDGDLARLVRRAWATVEAGNQPEPRLFRRGGIPTRILADDSGRPILASVDAATFRLEVARLAWCYRRVSVGRGASAEVPARLPLEVAEAALAVESLPLPVLERVVDVPIFGPDWRLCSRPGYHAAARVVYRPPAGFTLPHVPEVPDQADVDRAASLIRDELLGDFPFAEQADLANAVGLVLLPGVRLAIDGPTPLHGVDSPTPGTGKGLLVGAALGLWSESPGLIGPVRDDDELRKSITARLMEGRLPMWLDNPTHALDSPVLAAALTAETWTDRVLGQSRTVALPVRVVWAVSGNNLTVSTENARRTVPIRLDARVDRPWEREGFRHPALLAWVRENRMELVWACAVLVQHWLAAGSKPGTVRLGSFEEWSATIGGILEAAGIPGFLDNRRRLYEVSDELGARLRALVAAWWDKFESKPVRVSDLWPLWCQVEGIEADAESSRADRAERTKFGRLVGKQRDRIIAGYRIEEAGREHNTQRWQLLETAARGGHGDVGDLSLPQAANANYPGGVPDSHLSPPCPPLEVELPLYDGEVPAEEELG